MKIEKFGRYYIIQAILIIFEVVINLIIFAVPLAVNQIINGKLALTDRVIAFIIGFMLLEICIQFVYLSSCTCKKSTRKICRRKFTRKSIP